MDKTAASYSEAAGQPVGTNYQRTRPEPSSQARLYYIVTALTLHQNVNVLSTFDKFQIADFILIIC